MPMRPNILVILHISQNLFGKTFEEWSRKRTLSRRIYGGENHSTMPSFPFVDIINKLGIGRLFLPILVCLSLIPNLHGAVTFSPGFTLTANWASGHTLNLIQNGQPAGAEYNTSGNNTTGAYAYTYWQAPGGQYYFQITTTPNTLSWTLNLQVGSVPATAYASSYSGTGNANITVTYTPISNLLIPAPTIPNSGMGDMAGNGGEAHNLAVPLPSLGPDGVRIGDGQLFQSATDLAYGGMRGWGLTRTYSSFQSPAQAVLGLNWFISQCPTIQYSGSTYMVTSSPRSNVIFTLSGTTFYPSNYAQDTLVHSGASYIFTDTLGNITTFYDFTVSPSSEQGMFASFVDKGGNSTTATYTSGQLSSIQSSVTIGGVTTTNAIIYTYTSGLLTNAAYQQTIGSGSATTIRQAVYAYYGSGSSFGLANELESVTIEDGNTTPDQLEHTVYRYYIAGSSNPGGLEYILSSRNYDLMNQLGYNPLSDTTHFSTYANKQFVYNGSKQISQSIIAGNGSTINNSQQTINYTYLSQAQSGYNNYCSKTVETFPDAVGNTITRTIYANDGFQPLLDAYNGDGVVTCCAYSYDSAYRLIQIAEPSAVASYTPNDSADTLSITLNTGSGLIHHYIYGSTTNQSAKSLVALSQASSTVGGWVAGYLDNEYDQQGSSGTTCLIRSYLYESHTDSSSNITYPMVADTVYHDVNTTVGTSSNVYLNYTAPHNSITGLETTSYAWNFGTSNTSQVFDKTISNPVISSTENGPNTADVTDIVYDQYGRDIWRRDPESVLFYTAYDPASGSVTESIRDVDTVSTDPSYVGNYSNLPSGWGSVTTLNPRGSTQYGFNYTTTLTVDPLGRPLTIQDPRTDSTIITYILYFDYYVDGSSIVHKNEVRTYPAWNTTTHFPTGPTQVHTEYPQFGYFDDLNMQATPAYTGANLPNGTEAISSITSLARTTYDIGNQPVDKYAYFNFSSLSYTVNATPPFGTQNTNYYDTNYSYDALGNMCKEINAVGTIHQSIYDSRGAVIDSYIGTNDATTGTFSSTNYNSGTSNMVPISSNIYDSGGTGEHVLTSSTLYVTSSSDTRVRNLWYDWRDRLTATKDGVQGSETTTDGVYRPLVEYGLDNEGRVTTVSHFVGDTKTPSNVPSGNLREYATVAYDDQSRQYQKIVYGVNQSTGSITSTGLMTNSYYGHDGEILEVSLPGGQVKKYVSDRLLRPQFDFISDGGTGTTWSNAGSFTGDLIVDQNQYWHDGDDRLYLALHYDRDHNASGTGVLSGISQPLSRETAVCYWDDRANRSVAVADYGVINPNTFSRPNNVPTRSDIILVTQYVYNANGFLFQITNPRGSVTAKFTDMLGRVTKNVEAYDSTINSGNPQNSNNRTTWFAFDGLNHIVIQEAVMPTGTPTQQTAYSYGVSPSSSPASLIYSNDLPLCIKYPNSSTGSASSSPTNQLLLTYNYLGEVTTKTDGCGSTHTYLRDVLGRIYLDGVTSLGGNVDPTIRSIKTQFDSVDRAYLFSSCSDTGGATIVNQVQRNYNDLSQLTEEYQAVSGAVNTSSTPNINWSYVDLASSANNSKLLSMTYPNGRVLNYNYNSGIDTSISRISYLSDNYGSTHLEEYSYLGLSTPVLEHHPEPGMDYTMIVQSGDSPTTGDAGDQYNGLDRFGRLVDCRWLTTGTGTPAIDRFQYGYDRVNNLLYENNLMSSTFSTIYGANGPSTLTQAVYDPLNRMTSFARGILSASASGGTGPNTTTLGWPQNSGTNNAVLDTISTVNHPSSSEPVSGDMSWTLDQLGNWSSAVTDGTTDTRTHNAQNQITATSTYSSLTYDYDGNLTKENGTTICVFDAWNRAVNVKGSTFTYDAFGRRLTESDTLNSQYFYYSGWQMIENAPQSSSPPLHVQFVYGLDYIDHVILRDDNYTSGSLGASGSGLGRRLYYTHDREFSVTGLFGQSTGTWQMLERTAYDPFGGVQFFDASYGTPSSTSSHANTVVWKGRWLDPTGDIYNRLRYYDPVLGRYITRAADSYADCNQYDFQWGEPTYFNDPMGDPNTIWGIALNFDFSIGGPQDGGGGITLVGSAGFSEGHRVSERLDASLSTHTGGTGTRWQGRGTAFSGRGEFAISGTVTVGEGTGLPIPQYTVNSSTESAIPNTYKDSGSYTQEFTYDSVINRTTWQAAFNIRIDDFYLFYHNDSLTGLAGGAPLLRVGTDFSWTGGLLLGLEIGSIRHGQKPTEIELSQETYTGVGRGDPREFPADANTDNGRYRGADGSTYMNQGVDTDLDTTQTSLQFKHSGVSAGIDYYGAAWGQNFIHDHTDYPRFAMPNSGWGVHAGLSGGIQSSSQNSSDTLTP